MNTKYIHIIILSLLYFIIGEISFYLAPSEKIITISIFYPEGIALAFALFFGSRVIPGIFIGQLILALSNNIDLLPAIEISLINSIEALLGIYFFKKFRISRALSSFKDIFKLSGLIIFILQPFSAILSNTALVLYSQTSFDNFFKFTFSWWFGNVMGQLLLTPFLLLVFNRYRIINKKNLFLYSTLYSIYLFVLLTIFKISNPFLLFTFTLSIIIFITAKKDLIYGNLLILFTAIISSYSIKLHITIFSSLSPIDNTINYNIFIFSLLAITWIIGILFEERKQHQINLEKKIQQSINNYKKQQLFIIQQNKLAQIGELLNMIAHQWKQPLNNLALINQILIKQYEKSGLNDEDIQFFKTHSKKEIDYISNIINNFTNFFKTDEKITLFSINQTIENAINIIKPILNIHNIKIIIKSDDTYFIKGYPKAFSQAILNIITNAQEILTQNHIKNKTIIINITQNKKHTIIEIEDNGGGIKEEIIHKIFDPYFSTKTEKQGAGLGLYISKSIIEEQLDGKLLVENSIKGAKFIITLKGRENA